MVAPRSRPDAEWVSVNEAAAIVGRSRRTIYEWITRQLLTTRRVAGGPLQVKVSSLFQEDADTPPETPEALPTASSADTALATDDLTDDIEIDVE